MMALLPQLMLRAPIIVHRMQEVKSKEYATPSSFITD